MHVAVTTLVVHRRANKKKYTHAPPRARARARTQERAHLPHPLHPRRYYNTLVEHELGCLIKYGVVSSAALEADLTDWKHLYLAGRLHKPVVPLTGTLPSSYHDNLASASVPRPRRANPRPRAAPRLPRLAVTCG